MVKYFDLQIHTHEKSLNILKICFYPIYFIQMPILIAIIWQEPIEIRIIEACKINMSKKFQMKLACDVKKLICPKKISQYEIK